MTVTILAPNSPSASESFSIDSFMRSWYVTHSTLPLWKNKKDVCIAYSPIAVEPTPLRFNDTVTYRAQSASADSTPSRVEGVDTAIDNPSGASNSPPTRFKWRGKGWLVIASSRWQVLAFGTVVSPSNVEDPSTAEGRPTHLWALTFFEKTLFTPAGLDIYSSEPNGLPEALVTEIMEQAKTVEGDVGKLAHKFFKVGP